MTNQNKAYEIGEEINLLEEFTSEELETLFPKDLLKMINKGSFPREYKIIKRDADTVELRSTDNLGVELFLNSRIENDR